MACPPSANIQLYGSSIPHPKGKQRFYIFKYASRKPGIWAAKNPDKIGVFAEHIFFMFLLWRRGWDSNPCAIARKLLSSLLCNCDGGARFGVVSVSPVPAESRLKSGFFARKALRDGLFGKWVQIGIFPDFGEKCGKIGEKNRETAIHRRTELPTDEN